jgi:hypothetical protein
MNNEETKSAFDIFNEVLKFRFHFRENNPKVAFTYRLKKESVIEILGFLQNLEMEYDCTENGKFREDYISFEFLGVIITINETLVPTQVSL